MKKKVDIQEKIVAAIEKSGQMLLEDKKKKKLKIAVGENGKVKIIDFSKKENEK